MLILFNSIAIKWYNIISEHLLGALPRQYGYWSDQYGAFIILHALDISQQKQ